MFRLYLLYICNTVQVQHFMCSPGNLGFCCRCCFIAQFCCEFSFQYQARRWPSRSSL